MDAVVGGGGEFVFCITVCELKEGFHGVQAVSFLRRAS
jgi:hypothetical protein